MAVNHADGNLFVSILFYPCVALYVAIRAGASGFAIVFFLLACPLGYYYVMWSREVLYWILDGIVKVTTGRSMDEVDPSFWSSWIVGPPLMLFYLVAPFAIIITGIAGVAIGTAWTVTIVSRIF